MRFWADLGPRLGAYNSIATREAYGGHCGTRYPRAVRSGRIELSCPEYSVNLSEVVAKVKWPLMSSRIPYNQKRVVKESNIIWVLQSGACLSNLIDLLGLRLAEPTGIKNYVRSAFSQWVPSAWKGLELRIFSQLTESPVSIENLIGKFNLADNRSSLKPP